ncbi:MAG: methionine--tRNA ligase [Proteobacteria bacterium]|nr:methionine--tRNA ligase [Pseudomonadota bacterium]
MNKRRLLITSGLPYANGAIHLGHMVEVIQTDIFARAMRMMGHEALYMCADDTHGTPIEISATKRGIKPEQLIAEAWDSHVKDFKGFDIAFSHYYTTNSPENKALAYEIYDKLCKAGLIREEVVKQLYSETMQRFLPDRYVKGKCPKCGAEDQYGDCCEVCKAHYDALDLVDPHCVLDGSVPVVRESHHLFLSLSTMTEELRAYAESDALDPEVRNFVKTWIDEGLQDWNISRDKPYFGFEIPGHPDKYFYVWMDAPMGYIATTASWCKAHGESLDKYWKSKDTEVWHFIGKDIIYFHTLFWPAMLKVAGYSLPSHVHAHGFLTVNGTKMSKSRGTFILASKYLEVLPAAYLRFYFAAKLSTGVEDIDLNIEDFYFRVCSGLINNLANLHNRSFTFAEGKLGGKLSTAKYDDDCRKLIADAKARIVEIADMYANLNTAGAIKAICEIGDAANLFYQEKAPWTYLKGENADPEMARAIVTACAEVVRLIAIAIKPVVPDFSAKIFAQLGLDDQNLCDIDKPLGDGNVIAKVEKTYLRPERETFDKLVVDVPAEAPATVIPGEEKLEEKKAIEITRRPLKDAIDYSDFEKLDIRVGKILSAEKVKKSNKLVCCQIEIGHPDGPVQIVAGIAQHYNPDALVNRNVLVLTNLKPRELFGLTSHGMILAASDEAGLELPSTILRIPGAQVK